MLNKLWEKIKAFFNDEKPRLIEQLRQIEQEAEKEISEIPEKIEKAATEVVTEIKKRGRKKKA